MRCAICGNEFGNGGNCQNCGADRVSAFGSYSGYSVPNATNDFRGSQNGKTEAVAGNTLCWKCGEVIPGSFKFCPICGAKLIISCSRCGKSLSASFRFCPDCGGQLLRDEPNLHENQEASLNSRTAMLGAREKPLIKLEKELEPKKSEPVFELDEEKIIFEAKVYALRFYITYHTNPYNINTRIDDYFELFKWGTSYPEKYASRLVQYTLVNQTHLNSNDFDFLARVIDDAVSHVKLY